MTENSLTGPQGLDLLLSESEIRRLSYTYARGGDRIDPELFKSTFWPDGIWKQPGYDHEPIAASADSLLRDFMNRIYSCTHHANSNNRIEFISLDEARSEVYFTAFHLTRPGLSVEDLKNTIGPTRLAQESFDPKDTYEIIVGGRYLDVVERRAGVWKIRERRLVQDYTSVRKSSGIAPDEGLNVFGAKMTRDSSDPSYF